MYSFNKRSIPQGYKAVYTKNNNPAVIKTVSSAVSIPSHSTGNGIIPYFSGSTGEFSREVFDDSEKQITVKETPSGELNIPLGYHLVISQGTQHQEIISEEKGISTQAGGSSYSAAAGHVGINCTGGVTEPFPRCVFGTTTAVDSIPPNTHYVVTKSLMAGLPVVSEVNEQVPCTEAGNNPASNIGIVARGSSGFFRRLVLTEVPKAVVPVQSTFKSVASSSAADPLFTYALSLMDGYGNSSKNQERNRDFYTACFNGELNKVARLLPDVEPNAQENSVGATPLYAACIKGRAAVVALLLDDPRVNVNLGNKPGMTPLYAACLQGHETVVSLLLRAPGIDVHRKSNKGESPLEVAERRKHKAIIKLLSDHAQAIPVPQQRPMGR